MSGKIIKICAVTDSRLLGKLTREAEFVGAGCGQGNVCDPVPFEPDH